LAGIGGIELGLSCAGHHASLLCCIVITDDGDGMTRDDINSKYLTVGYGPGTRDSQGNDGARLKATWDAAQASS